MDAYSLALASVVLTAGAVSDRYGRRKVFLLGIAVLAAGSLIGALAPDANVVIAGRALMGVGGAMFMPGTLSIITHVFDRVTRPTAIGIWGAVTSLGVIVGPLISGAVLQIWHWRGIFVLNVVMAAIASRERRRWFRNRATRTRVAWTSSGPFSPVPGYSASSTPSSTPPPTASPVPWCWPRRASGPRRWCCSGCIRPGER